MRLFTLLAWYAAWLAVAMKYRKDAGKSKLEADPTKSKMDNFLDEVVDIHKSAYAEVKDYVTANFDDVHDFDSLKAKASGYIDQAATEAEALIASLRAKGTAKKEELESEVDALFDKKDAILDEAKTHGASLADTTTDTLTSWIETAKAKLVSLRDQVKSDLQTETPAPVKKAPTKKPAARKAPAKKPQA